MHPLGIAINCKYNVEITQGMEVKADHFRLDHAFNVFLGGPEKKEPVMIVEFKRLGLIKPEEFREASCNVEELANTLNDMKKGGRRYALEKNSNAWWFTKQAAAYAVKWDCRFVALCDYENLILLQFGEKKDKKKRDGNFAHISIVDRNAFLKNLLGFLIEACEAKKLT